MNPNTPHRSPDNRPNVPPGTRPSHHEHLAQLAYQELISPPNRSPGGHYMQQSPMQQSPVQSPVQHQNPAYTYPSPTGSWSSSGGYPESSQQGSSHSQAYSPQSPSESSGIAEEKRRKNTEASARFRIRKKEKMANIEETLSSLQRRAEDLEREAGELRRENGWLKEIVIMKGRQRNSKASGASKPGESGSPEGHDEDEGSDQEEE